MRAQIKYNCQNLITLLIYNIFIIFLIIKYYLKFKLIKFDNLKF